MPISSWMGIIAGANWSKLVKKYKDIMPTYVRY